MNKETAATAIKWGLAIATMALLAPVIFLAVQGLVGLAIAIIVGLAVINFAPVLAVRFANWKLLGLKDAARKNPIETRQNLGIQMRKRLAAQEQNLKELIAETNKSKAEVASLPPDEAATFQEQLDALIQIVTLRKGKYKAAQEACNEFDKATGRAERRWKVAQTLLKTRQLAGSVADKEQEKILASESLDSVERTMHEAFSELEMEMANDLPAIPHSPGIVIDVPSKVFSHVYKD